MNRKTALENIPLSETQIPLVGFGTYLIEDSLVGEVVEQALEAGYRHIDTAEGYFNEAGIGKALKNQLAANKLNREELFITTKLWPGNPAWGETTKDFNATLKAAEESLKKLNLDYIDLYLIHAPFGAQQRIEEWKALVELKKQGKVKAIGVSNFNVNHIEEIKAQGLPVPEFNQVELHPWSQKKELRQYLKQNGIQPIAYSSLVPLSTWRTKPGQDSAKTQEMIADSSKADSPFKAIAKEYDVTEAQLLLKWAVQQGIPVLPKSTNPERMKINLDLFSFEIKPEHMEVLNSQDRGDGVAWAIGDPIKND